MKWAIQANEEVKNKPQTFSADGWTGNQRSSQMWWRNEQELLSPEPKTVRTSELNGSGEGGGNGIRGPRSFVPVGDTNWVKRRAFYPGWWLQPEQKSPIGIKGSSFVPIGASNWDKRLLCPAGTASRWTRDKNHLLSQVKRQPWQMT